MFVLSGYIYNISSYFIFLDPFDSNKCKKRSNRKKTHHFGFSHVLVERELFCPPQSHALLTKVGPGGAARPAPAVDGIAVLVLDEQVALLGLAVDVVAGVDLDVRVDDGDELAAVQCQVLHHLLGVRELDGVPREVALAVGVLDVEPEDVEGQLVLLEAGVHGAHVLLVVVVPAALVVGGGEEGRQGGGARQLA